MTKEQAFFILECRKARTDFLTFRTLINPDLVMGWWQEEIASELMAFHAAMVRGERPKLVIQAPPQHGKSRQIVEFIAWATGVNPDLKTIYASFSEDLGVRANLTLQNIYTSKIYKYIFPETQINERNTVAANRGYLRNKSMLEFVNRQGSFVNTTVQGQITGKSMTLGCIDDPTKGRQEANSLTTRNAVWNWFTDDFSTRLSKDGAFIIIMTRWHVDDLVGRLAALNDKTVRILSYPAIATCDEKHRKAGEALFQELKPLDFLLERKRASSTQSFESLYQQNPIIVGGEIIKREWFKSYSMLPPLDYVCIFADTAQKTAEHNDYSVLQAWGYANGQIYLVDQVRGKFEAPELKRTAIAFWQKHKSSHVPCRAFYIEDKSSGTGLIQDIKREGSVPVIAVQRTKDKLTRVQDVLSYIEAGYLHLPNNAPFLSDYLAEMEEFSGDNGHRHDDQIDPTIDAINVMLSKQNNSIFTREMFE
jgi:predicted phage terminase large subunit-like protein